jgi:hypothetical protein
LVFYDVYNELGFGFLESVYRQSMQFGLGDAGLRFGPKPEFRRLIYSKDRQICGNLRSSAVE